MLYIFDMGGVVTTTAGNSLVESIAENLGITAGKFYEYSGINSGRNLLAELDNGFLDVREFWRIFEKNSGIPVRCDWFRLLFHPVLDKKTVDLICELRRKGNRVVCGTNTIESHYDNHISRGDYSFFDMTYASVHMGVSKPDPEFWKLILKCEGVEPENAFFTDDKEENCRAAASLGIKTYHFDSADGLIKNIC